MELNVFRLEMPAKVVVGGSGSGTERTVDIRTGWKAFIESKNKTK